MSETVVFDKDDNYIDLFCSLPAKLYGSDEIMQDAKTERKLLKGEHVLSHYFATEGMLVLDGQRKPLARCMMTYYHESEIAYLGFFETVDDQKVSGELLHAAQAAAKARGRSRIVGPLNASFWIGYRLKTNSFHRPYMGEPYNKAYYMEHLTAAGYEVSDLYHSHHFAPVDISYDNEAFAMKLQEKEKQGYRIVSPDRGSFIKCLGEIYDLIIELYSTFPGYQRIEKEEFMELFGSLKYVIDYSMVKMAYYGEQAVAFYVSVPNYHNLTAGKITLSKLARILGYKRKPREYVMLYLGVDPAHKGLGMALTEVVKKQLQVNRAASFGALIHTGKPTGEYYKELIEEIYEYALLEKAI